MATALYLLAVVVVGAGAEGPQPEASALRRGSPSVLAIKRYTYLAGMATITPTKVTRKASRAT
jgi:hypothetical protein